MQIVIDIPEEKYDWIMQHLTLDRNFRDCKINLLPKGHGRLVDADMITKRYRLDNATKYGNKDVEQQTFSYSTMMMYEIADMIEDAETIIEADKENR